jgi:hypothetical protein
MSFLVAGWSASLGHDWNQAWLSGEFTATGYFGLSGMAAGRSGDPTPTPLPPLDLFGGATGLQNGFDLVPVPEPSVMTLEAAAGAVLLLRYGHRRSASNALLKKEESSRMRLRPRYHAEMK